MNDIRALIRIARQRMEMTTFIAMLHGAALVTAGVFLVLALADRAAGASFVAWAWVLPALAVVTLGTAAVLWARQRATDHQVAVTVDDRLDLRERLSTAIHCQGRDDAFAMAAVEDAVTTARNPRARETIRRRFAVQAPSRWWVSPLMAIAATAVLLGPQANLFARDPEVDPKEMEKARVAVDESLDVIVNAVKEQPQLSEELAGLVDELTATPPEGAVQRPEDLKRDALKKITELSKRLDEIVNGEKGKTAKAIESMLSKLEAPAEGPAKELAEALAAGDFQKAKQSLEAMMADIQKGGMDPEQQEQLAEQLAQMGQALQDLANQQQALQQALKQAGLNPQLANNPQALQQALQQAQNLNEQQKQQLQQMVNAQQQAQKMCQNLGGACQQMAQAMQGGKPGDAGQMMNQLNQMEQMQQLLKQAQAAAGQCQGQGIGQGMSLNQALQQWRQGAGMGQRGQGAGGKAPIAPTPTGTRLVKADVPVVDGEIIASMLIDGNPIRGESKAKLKKVVSAAAEGFDESVSEEQIPRKYQKAHQHYFGELQRQVEAVPAAGTASGDGDEPANDGNANDGGG